MLLGGGAIAKKEFTQLLQGHKEVISWSLASLQLMPGDSDWKRERGGVEGTREEGWIDGENKGGGVEGTREEGWIDGENKGGGVEGTREEGWRVQRRRGEKNKGGGVDG